MGSTTLRAVRPNSAATCEAATRARAAHAPGMTAFIGAPGNPGTCPHRHRDARDGLGPPSVETGGAVQAWKQLRLSGPLGVFCDPRLQSGGAA